VCPPTFDHNKNDQELAKSRAVSAVMQHYSQLATMILGNNLFGMASLPQARALPSVYFRYFYPHVTASQYSQCSFLQ